MTKFISFSVYGSDDKYLLGAVRNAELASKIYPEWQAIFYVDDSLGDEFINKLEYLGAKVILRNLSSSLHGVFWRFEAMRLPDAEAIIFRDVDSRLSLREASAVQEWLSSTSELHAMRDHPFHSSWILAGMWGARGNLLKKIEKELPISLPLNAKWGVDQQWLAEKVYKPFQKNIFIHDSFFRREKSSFFPEMRVDGEYVGEVIDENGCYAETLRQLVISAEKSSVYFSKLIVRDWFRVRLEQSLSRSQYPYKKILS